MTDENRARPKGILVIGTISIIFGVLGLLLAALQIIVVSKAAQEQALPRLTMLYSTVPYVAAGIAWIVAGVGIFALRNWARVTTIVLSALAAGFSILTFVVTAIAFIFIGITKGSPGMLGMVVISAIGIILLAIFAGTPIAFIVYLNKGETKKNFVVRPGAIRRPLGVNILIVLYFFGVLGIVSVFVVDGIPVCGIILRGIWFWLFQILFTGISLYLAIGFLKLKRAAWITAIYYNAFLMLNGLLTNSLVTPEEIMQLSGTEVPRIGFYPGMYQIFFWFGIALNGVIIFYLLRKKKIFVN